MFGAAGADRGLLFAAPRQLPVREDRRGASQDRHETGPKHLKRPLEGDVA
jgi:hypothetical protein